MLATRWNRSVAIVLAASALLTTLAAPVALAALESGQVPAHGTVVEGVDAWLDRPLPAGAPGGSTIQVGATIWSTTDAGPIGGSSVFFRLFDPDGTDFTEVVSIEDWRGHFLATLVVPAAGAGVLVIGTQGTACDDGACVRSDAIYAIAGVGPPPAAPLPAIATAAIEAPGIPLSAGRTLVVGISLTPRADWATGTFVYPSSLRLVIREPRGADLDVVAAIGSDGSYEATVVLPAAGEYALQAAATGDGSTGAGAVVDTVDLFTTSSVLIDVTDEPPDAVTAPPSGSPGDPGDPAGASGDRLASLIAALAIIAAGISVLVVIGRRNA